MNMSGPWPIPKTLQELQRIVVEAQALGFRAPQPGRAWPSPRPRAPCSTAPLPSPHCPARSGPDGSWRDQSSSLTVSCASARVDTTIGAAEQPANTTAASSATFPVFQWSIVAFPPSAMPFTAPSCFVIAQLWNGIMKGFDAMIQPGRAGRMARTELAADVARSGTCDRNQIAYALEPYCPRGRARPNLRSPGLQPPLPREHAPGFPGRRRSWGATMVEIDVVLTADGEPIILHDLTVDRTTDGHGFAADLSLERIRSLDAGSWFHQRFARTRIPTLVEVLDWANGEGMRLLVEIKEAERADLAVDRVASLVAATDTVDRVVLISFDHVLLKRAVKRHPGIRTEAITHAATPTSSGSCGRAARVPSPSSSICFTRTTLRRCMQPVAPIA